MYRLPITLLLTVVLAIFTQPLGIMRRSVATSSDRDMRAFFQLELPETGDTPITAPEARVTASGLTRLTLRILKPLADDVDYGKIHTRINGEAADVIFDRSSDARGYVLRGDLTLWPRFKLVQGKNVIEISALDRNMKSYYASYILLTGGDADASGATTESVPVTQGEDRQPPTIRLSQTSRSIRIAEIGATILISGLVFDDSGVVTSVTVDDRAVRLAPPADARSIALKRLGSGGLAPEELKNAYTFAQQVSVKPDSTSVVIEAKDKAGNLTRLTLSIRRREAAISAGFTGRKFALVVGVSLYKFQENGLYNLAYADADARAVRDFLQSREGGGFAPSDIEYLENEQATTSAVRAALDSFLPRAGAQDLIFIFIAGHGSPDPYAPQKLYFILHDTKVSDMPGTALPMDELKNALEHKVRARRLVVFVDTCHSAGLSGEKLAATRGLENNLINLYASHLFSGEGRAVITSSDVNEVSQENPRWGGGHGVFTWALLEGLHGEADANGDRFVTAGELFDFVRNRVRAETSFRQNPRALLGLNSDLPLSFTSRR